MSISGARDIVPRLFYRTCQQLQCITGKRIHKYLPVPSARVPVILRMLPPLCAPQPSASPPRQIREPLLYVPEREQHTHAHVIRSGLHHALKPPGSTKTICLVHQVTNQKRRVCRGPQHHRTWTQPLEIACTFWSWRQWGSMGLRNTGEQQNVCTSS